MNLTIVELEVMRALVAMTLIEAAQPTGAPFQRAMEAFVGQIGATEAQALPLSNLQRLTFRR